LNQRFSKQLNRLPNKSKPAEQEILIKVDFQDVQTKRKNKIDRSHITLPYGIQNSIGFTDDHLLRASDHFPMVNSRFEYVKDFEREERLLRDTFIVVEVHGSRFKSFCSHLSLSLPYDDRLIRLFATAARSTMENFFDIEVSLGYSDNFYFVFDRSASLFNRRRDKILSNLISFFTSAFVFHWTSFFTFPIPEPPDFFGRLTLFPRRILVKEFLMAKQQDAATTCITEYVKEVLVRSGQPADEAFGTAIGLSFTDQNELLFRHGINFNSLPAWHKRGKLLIREKKIIETSDDLFATKPDFWKKHPKLLKSKHN
jgi:tRNA(His) guanylyltransferase